MYYNEEAQLGGWFTEICMYCGSKNHIYISMPDAHAWECYCCGHRSWIDGLGKEMYILEEGAEESNAEEHLHSNETNVRFLYGNYERY